MAMHVMYTVTGPQWREEGRLAGAPALLSPRGSGVAYMGAPESLVGLRGHPRAPERRGGGRMQVGMLAFQGLAASQIYVFTT